MGLIEFTPRALRAGRSILGDRERQVAKIRLVADEHVVADKDHRRGQPLFLRHAILLAQPLVERRALVDGEHFHDQLRISLLHQPQIVGSAGALLAASLFKVGQVDRLLRRFTTQALHCGNLDAALRSVLLDQPRQIAFDLVDAHQHPLADQDVRRARRRFRQFQRRIVLGE